MTTAKTIRCAIYTRKSHEEGLEQDYNSLDAQRDAGISYINSQKHEGWQVIPKQYDDGGYSGGNIDRPALQELLTDIRSGFIDCVVVYKVDRLSRSLIDFAGLINLFDSNDVTFVSVTQNFNTTTSMGRLTLNILLSFAQFERELCGERIRDKKLATAKKGKYIGGGAILGYDVIDKKYAVNNAEAKIVRKIYKLALEEKSCRQIAEIFNKQGLRTKRIVSKTGRVRGDKLFDYKNIYRILTDRKYFGDIVHKGNAYPGEHEAIIKRDDFEAIKKLLYDHGPKKSDTGKGKFQIKKISLLGGLAFCQYCNEPLKPTSTFSKGRVYRYYTCTTKTQYGSDKCPLPVLNSGQIEQAVIRQLRRILKHPDIAARIIQKINSSQSSYQTNEIIAALQDTGRLWDMLFPDQQKRIVQLLLRKITASEDGFKLHFLPNGIETIVAQINERYN